jgi:hypothetical protein
VDIAQFSQAAEEALPSFLHLFPGGMRVNGRDAIGHRSTAAQGYAQIVYRIGLEGDAGAVTLFKDALHPESQA